MDLPVRTLYQTLLCRFAHELECGELAYVQGNRISKLSFSIFQIKYCELKGFVVLTLCVNLIEVFDDGIKL